MNISRQPWTHPNTPAGVDKRTYQSDQDGIHDWALALPPLYAEGKWVVHLHGHGSIGDQIFTREDIRASWLTRYRALGLGVLSPNLHGNAWMCPEAVADLHDLLAWVRKEYEVKSFYIVSGSMGGTGNLIYAIIHPEDVTALVALCPVTDIVAYHGWCQAHPGGVRDAIRLAIESAYHGRPDQVPDQYSGHIVTPYADRLTMPLFLAHATGDEVIPVKQSRELQRSLANAPNAVHVELAGGNNDTPLFQSGMLEWLEQQIIRRR